MMSGQFEQFKLLHYITLENYL